MDIIKRKIGEIDKQIAEHKEELQLLKSNIIYVAKKEITSVYTHSVIAAAENLQKKYNELEILLAKRQALIELMREIKEEF